MGIPLRSLKFDTLLRALHTAAFWPVMVARSLAARSSSFLSTDRLADAHRHHDLVQPGDGHAVSGPRLLKEHGEDLVTVFLKQASHAYSSALSRVNSLRRDPRTDAI